MPAPVIGTATIAIRVESETVRPDSRTARIASRPTPAAATRRRSGVPYQHNVLFQEPAYEDGQPYAPDSEDDDE